MVVAILGMLIVNLTPTDQPIWTWHPIFWLESLTLAAFGISWLVKGETLLKDPS